MTHISSPEWILLNDAKQFKELIERSKDQPILIFKFNSGNGSHLNIKSKLEKEWNLEQDIENYLLDTGSSPDLSSIISAELGILNNQLQVILLADEVAIYDESDDMITIKKINLALKIISRTFKWSASRTIKKASG